MGFAVVILAAFAYFLFVKDKSWDASEVWEWNVALERKGEDLSDLASSEETRGLLGS